MSKQNGNTGFLHGTSAFFRRIGRSMKSLRMKFNSRFGKRLTSQNAGLLTVFITGIFAVILLFIPYMRGVADDGSLSQIMQHTGLAYRYADAHETTGAYAVQYYRCVTPEPDGISIHEGMIRFAILLCHGITGNNDFDIRFLGVLYLILYLPAVYLISFQCAQHVKYPSEKMFLAVLTALIYSDASCVMYFNSLYPEALWQILLLYGFGLCLSLQTETEQLQELVLSLLCLIASLIAFTEKHMYLCTIMFALYVLARVLMRTEKRQVRIVAGMASLIMLVFALIGLGYGTERFSAQSKYNAMTNGVLLESDNPAKTLSYFGIDERFEILTDTSVNADYPVVLTDNNDLQENFLDMYSTADLALYYMQHPLSLFRLLNVGTGIGFSQERTYVGNFTKDTGLPERARTPIFRIWSLFKSSALPKTAFTVLLLLVVFLLLIRQPRSKPELLQPHQKSASLATFLLAFAMIFVHLTYIILRSGSAEFIQYNLVTGVCIDLMLLLIMTDILHRLNFLETEDNS